MRNTCASRSKRWSASRDTTSGRSTFTMQGAPVGSSQLAAKTQPWPPSPMRSRRWYATPPVPRSILPGSASRSDCRRESTGCIRALAPPLLAAPASDAEQLEKRFLVREPDVATRLFAALEDDDGGNAADAELGGDARRVVDVELADLHLAEVLVRDLL